MDRIVQSSLIKSCIQTFLQCTTAMGLVDPGTRTPVRKSDALSTVFPPFFLRYIFFHSICVTGRSHQQFLLTSITAENNEKLFKTKTVSSIAARSKKYQSQAKSVLTLCPGLLDFFERTASTSQVENTITVLKTHVVDIDQLITRVKKIENCQIFPPKLIQRFGNEQRS